MLAVSWQRAARLSTAGNGFYVQSAAATNLMKQILFSYTRPSGYMIRLREGVASPCS
jgi:hypothetical protein